MPIETELIKDNRVVLQTYRNPLTTEDFHELKKVMEDEILSKSQHVVHIIADFRGVSSVPRTILTSGINMMNRAHPNTGIVVCVIENEFINAIARIFSGVLSSRRVRLVKSIQSAYETIDLLLAERV
jgi:hypothetical protein